MRVPDDVPNAMGVGPLPQLHDVTLLERVYETLRNLILCNKILPGRPLSITSLAKELGVSPTPVREALAKLCAEGLAQRVPNKTARVAGIKLGEVAQIYELRKLLEPYATAQLAKSLSANPSLRTDAESIKDDLCQLINALRKSEPYQNVFDLYLIIDIKIQEILERGITNHFLQVLVRQINQHSRRLRSFAEAIEQSNTDMLLEVALEHLGIIESVLASDVKGTEGKVRHHLDRGQVRTLGVVQNWAKKEKEDI